MSDLMEFINSRKPKDMSQAEYARHLGVTDSALYYYAKKQRGMRVESLRGFADYFRSVDDTEALSVLASYAIGTDGVFTPS